MVVKLHDVREMVSGALTDAKWDNLVGVDIDDKDNRTMEVTFNELEDRIVESKYRITIELID